MASNKRRLIPIVDRRFQLKYTSIIVAVAAVVSTALGYLLLDAYREMNAMLEVNEAIGARLDGDDARRVFYIVIGFLVAEVAFLGVLGLLVTHRVCGPIFVLQRHLGALFDGGYPQLRPLRARDEFRGAFEIFSDVVRQLKERDDKERAELLALVAAAREQGMAEQHLAALQRMLEEREARLAAKT